MSTWFFGISLSNSSTVSTLLDGVLRSSSLLAVAVFVAVPEVGVFVSVPEVGVRVGNVVTPASASLSVDRIVSFWGFTSIMRMRICVPNMSSPSV